MNKTPRYITQIDSNWIRDVSAAANLEVGKGLKVERTGDKLRISLDEDTFKLMIYAILDQTVRTTGFHYVTPANYTLDYEMPAS